VGRSKGIIGSVKVPVRWDIMTDRQKTRLSHITGRDTRVIKAYLGVIERNEKDLLVGIRKKKISASELDKLTLTATRGKASRTSVPHDFKNRFPNISVNEFQECRDTAIAMWQSHLERGGSRPFRAKGYSSRKIPRFAFGKCFDFLYTPEKEIKHWLSLRYSVDSVKRNRRIHERLLIPLSPSSYHLRKLEEGDLKTVRLFKDRRRKWWIIFTVTIDAETTNSLNLPFAVMGIDLGIEKAACTVLLTKQGYKHVCYWKQRDKLRRMKYYDDTVASLQRKKERNVFRKLDVTQITKQLRQLSEKRARLSKEYDNELVKNIAEHIRHLSKNYSLYVVMGRLKGIRWTARRGNYRGRKFRGMVHRWSFARLRKNLEHKLATLGFDTMKFFAVSEVWTSITCHKCGSKGYRPKQNLFICGTCGFRANADLNGAINIGRRIIKLIPSLSGERTGLGVWLLPNEKTIPKTSRNSRSKRKSTRSQRKPVLMGESVAECNNQTSREMNVSTKDPAVVSTVEKLPASKMAGSLGVMQRIETRRQGRNNVPLNLDKAHVTSHDSRHLKAGDSSREQGETQKFLSEFTHS
jgi:transposase